MAKLPMKRIEIAAFLQDRKQIMERLQRQGTVEINDCTNDEVSKIDTASSVALFEKSIHTASSAKEILEKYAPAEKSLFASFRRKREITPEDFERYSLLRDEYLKTCYALIDYDRCIAENRAAIVRIKLQCDSLEIWRNLDIPMTLKGSKYSRFFIGTFPNQKTCEDILIEIAEKDSSLDAVSAEIISSFKEKTCAVIICHREIAGTVEERLREIGFQAVTDPADKVPAEKITDFENEIRKLNDEIDETIKKIQNLKNKYDDIEFLIDYFTMRKEKYIALGKIGMTKKTFVVCGYIPEKNAKKCADELEAGFTAAVNVIAPSDEEDVPVLLENNDFAAPMEAITEMYAVPGKGDIDPSPVMAFFYYMFFGIMLSDAGYGALMALVSAIALKKLYLEESMRKSLKMFFYSGISTVFWGAMFGSWFGDIVPIIYTQFLGKEAPELAIWFNPISDPIRFLLAAFGFGIIHLFVALAVKFKMNWDSGNKADAFLDVIPVYLLVAGAAPLAAGILVSVPTILLTIGKYMALIGVVSVILTAGRSSKNIFGKLGGGLYGFYNTASGYLSDILSYSRLLALGLATGSIAGVINMMGVMPDNLLLKGLLLTVVFLIGHPLNMAINLLGAYVHTNRLQFVEFFSKFYEGGGRAFSPFKANTKYITFKEEN